MSISGIIYDKNYKKRRFSNNIQIFAEKVIMNPPLKVDVGKILFYLILLRNLLQMS